MWFISILLSVGFTFYLIISSITAYYDYDTVSKVEVFYPPEIHFPAVTMCFRYVKDQKNILFMKKKFNNEVLDNYILDSVKVQPSLFLSSDSPKCCFRFNGGDLSSPITFFKSERSYSVGGFKIKVFPLLFFAIILIIINLKKQLYRFNFLTNYRILFV